MFVVHSFSVRHVGMITPLSHKTDGAVVFTGVYPNQRAEVSHRAAR